MPEAVVLGIGCERGIAAASVLEGVREFLAAHAEAPFDLRRAGTIALKRDEAGLVRAAEHLGIPLDFWSVDELGSVGPLPNPSELVRRVVGVAGVAEPAAMLSGDVGRLRVPKTVLRPRDRRMTLSLAACRRTSRRKDGVTP